MPSTDRIAYWDSAALLRGVIDNRQIVVFIQNRHDQIGLLFVDSATNTPTEYGNVMRDCAYIVLSGFITGNCPPSPVFFHKISR